VAGLAVLADLLGAQGRVLPVSARPLTIHAQVREATGELAEVIGQHRVAIAQGDVERIWIEPADPVPVPESVAAILNADVALLGPGSWFTSVLPHLLIREIHDALVVTAARRVLITNLRPRTDRETWGLPLDEHIRILHRYAPALRIDAIVVDPAHADNPASIRAAAALVGASVIEGAVEDRDIPGTHDPASLGAVLAPMVTS